jgi:predicted benzoate:H+ symporter BenE
MTADTWVGVGGAVLMAGGVLLKWKARRRVPKAVAVGLPLFGWMLFAEFLLRPLVPTPVVVAVLLGGITLGIFLAAFLGGRRGRRPPG